MHRGNALAGDLGGVADGLAGAYGAFANAPHDLAQKAVANISVGQSQFSSEESGIQDHLRDALERATEAADQWFESNRDALNIAKIECSDHVLKVHAELSRTCRDLHTMGFDLFKTRISALQLGELKAQSLYDGSSDYAKYQAPAIPPMMQNLKSLWHLDGGKDQRSYVDHPVPAMARNAMAWQARNTELQRLLKKGQSELSAALKVAAAA